MNAYYVGFENIKFVFRLQFQDLYTNHFHKSVDLHTIRSTHLKVELQDFYKIFSITTYNIKRCELSIRNNSLLNNAGFRMSG